jgi:hypothetical protein
MEIQFVERYVLVHLVVETKTPALVHRLAEISAYAQSSLNQEINFLAHWNRQLNVVPALRIRLGDRCLRPDTAARAPQYRSKKQEWNYGYFHRCLASV